MMITTVWIVMHEDYEQTWVNSAFSTEEGANAYCAELGVRRPKESFSVIGCPVDDPAAAFVDTLVLATQSDVEKLRTFRLIDDQGREFVVIQHPASE